MMSLAHHGHFLFAHNSAHYSALSERLCTAEGAVGRLVIDHRSHIGQAETALKWLGTSLLITARDT